MKSYIHFKNRFSSLVLVLFVFAGCVHQPIPLTKHDEVLIYNRSYDYTYFGAVQAVSSIYPWDVALTDKEKGTIRVYNRKYWSTLDADKRTATLLVKRISPKKTSVELIPESQTVIGVEDVLSAVDKTLGRYRG